MDDFRTFFRGKKITVMGLGLLGRGLGYTKFLAECGADLIVTDQKTSRELSTSLEPLRKYKNIKFVLGKHCLEDFRNRDMVIKSAGVPLDSKYIAEARKNKIPVEMDVSLFLKLAPKMKVIGVTGTRGKSMTTAIIYEILKKNEKFLGKKVYIGGNVRGIATLPLLKKVKAGDILVCELDSWQLQGFGEAKMSPNISVFTSFMPDHMNYYGNDMKKYFADKANIFKYQNKSDVLIVLPTVQKLIPKNIKSKLIITNSAKVSKYEFIVPGEHQRANLACAVEVAKRMGIPETKIKSAVKNFKGLPGRLEYLREWRGVKIYNDNNATTPQATLAGLQAVDGVFLGKKIVLLAGGADKNLDLDELKKEINKLKALVLLPGTGTDKLLRQGGLIVERKKALDLSSALKQALQYTEPGDILLFSPAFASFGLFSNEYERGDQFVELVKRLK
jgi:UDP-N-acetylmuramoylalanine--D-glutamate ligase